MSRRKKKLAKIIFITFCFSLVLTPLIESNALFGIPEPVIVIGDTTPQTAAIVAATAASAAANVSAAAAIGVVGTGSAAVAPFIAAREACILANGSIFDILDQTAITGGFSLLGVSPVEAAALQTKILRVTIALECLENTVLRPAMAINISLIDIEALNKSVITPTADDINALNGRLDDLRQRLTQSTTRIMKAIAVQILTQFVSSLTEEQVNKLVNKYSDPSALATIRTLRDNVYSIEQIQKVYKNKDDQSIIFSLLKNSDQYLGKITPLVRAKAQDNLSTCEALSKTFEEGMLCNGAMGNTPIWLQLQYEDKAQETKAVAEAAAVTENVRDAGNRSTRTCDENSYNNYKTDLEQSIQLAEQVDIASATKGDLLDQGADQQAITVAEAAYQDSLNNLKGFTNSQPLAAFCSGITNPGKFSGDVIKNLIDNNSETVRELNKDNLPFLGTLIKNLLGRYLNSILTGNKPGATILQDDAISAANYLVPTLLQGSGDLGTLSGQLPPGSVQGASTSVVPLLRGPGHQLR